MKSPRDKCTRKHKNAQYSSDEQATSSKCNKAALYV